MASKTITWVGDISPFESHGKTTHYTNVAFADGSTGSLGKQDIEAAAELHDLLVALTGTEAEFGLEDRGKPNKKGQPSYTIKSFPGYEPEPYVQRGREEAVSRVGERRPPARSPEHDQFIQERMDRRTALMQAVTLRAGVGGSAITDIADSFYSWLRQTSGTGTPPSESDVSTSPVPGTTSPPSSTASDSPGPSARSGGGDQQFIEDGEDSVDAVVGGGQESPGEASPTPTTAEHVHERDPDLPPNKLGRGPCIYCGVYVK